MTKQILPSWCLKNLRMWIKNVGFSSVTEAVRKICLHMDMSHQSQVQRRRNLVQELLKSCRLLKIFLQLSILETKNCLNVQVKKMYRHQSRSVIWGKHLPIAQCLAQGWVPWISGELHSINITDFEEFN